MLVRDASTMTRRSRPTPTTAVAAAEYLETAMAERQVVVKPNAWDTPLARVLLGVVITATFASLFHLSIRIDRLDTKIDTRIGEVQADIKELRREVQADIKELRREVQADISGLKADIGELRSLVIKALASDSVTAL